MNIDAFYNADTNRSSVIHTRSAYFLDHNIRRFDAHRFNIPPSEAGAMDPDQRGLMETTYHALENAGITYPSLTGSNTSVHVGFSSSDHITFSLRDPLRIPNYYITGYSLEQLGFLPSHKKSGLRLEAWLRLHWSRSTMAWYGMRVAFRACILG
jgi:acyl transferase domain-containing protein